jgi:hypothetical protein
MHHVELKHGLINRLQRQQWNSCLKIFFRQQELTARQELQAKGPSDGLSQLCGEMHSMLGAVSSHMAQRPTVTSHKKHEKIRRTRRRISDLGFERRRGFTRV